MDVPASSRRWTVNKPEPFSYGLQNDPNGCSGHLFTHHTFWEIEHIFRVTVRKGDEITLPYESARRGYGSIERASLLVALLSLTVSQLSLLHAELEPPFPCCPTTLGPDSWTFYDRWSGSGAPEVLFVASEPRQVNFEQKKELEVMA
jgi:hypothetical protein